jgi:hypothetical protein
MQKLVTIFFSVLRELPSLQPWELPASDGSPNKSQRTEATILGSVEAQWL